MALDMVRTIDYSYPTETNNSENIMKIQITRAKAEKAVITAMSQLSQSTDTPMTEFLVAARFKGTEKFESMVTAAFAKLQAKHA